jgi:transposase
VSTHRPDKAREALGELAGVLRENATVLAEAADRADELAEKRDSGLSYREIVPAERRPLIVETISSVMASLTRVGSRWRREEARALHDEGMSMDKIAALFGVTRQRVSALLRNGSPS